MMASNKSGPHGRGYPGTPYSTLTMQGINPDIIGAARLFQGYALQYPGQELHEKAIHHSEFLISVAEHPDAAKELSLITQVPEIQLQEYAQGILDLLIFNGDNNPHVSLGLTKQASRAEISRRWKRLVILNHPDRYGNKKIYEERTKRINEAYERILSKKNRPGHEPFNDLYQTPLPIMRYQRAHNFKYLRHLPALILTIAIIIAIISILLFIRRVAAHSPAGSTGQTEKEIVLEYVIAPGSAADRCHCGSSDLSPTAGKTEETGSAWSCPSGTLCTTVDTPVRIWDI